MMNYTVPFVRFSLDEGGAVFRLPFNTASIAWKDIVRAALVQPMIPIGKGVEFQLERHAPMTVWTDGSTCVRILDLCEQHGVPVTRDAAFRI